MTENEAITMMKNTVIDYKNLRNGLECKVMIDIAIKAMEEVQEYRKIGTVEECREVIEKTKAKKPDYEGNGYADGHMVYDTWICPNCGVKYEVDYEQYDFCPDCGQKIDWSDENE